MARLPVISRFRPNRWWAALVLAVAVAAAAFVVVWFEPQKLWIDDRATEPAPTAPLGADAAAPVEIASGEFVSREHRTSGRAVLLRVGTGRHVVRLEGFGTSNGPDLYVYLSANRANGPEGAFDDDHVNLGKLKGNQGDQNYDVPGGGELGPRTTVVIWCDRFNAVFGAADLAPA